MARTDEGIVTRRKEAVARFLEEAQWVSGDFGFKVPAPAAHRDAEVQRVSLLEYAADVLGAVREARQAQRQDKAPDPPADEATESDKTKGKATK